MNMKKLLLASLCVGIFASCNVKDSAEYKALQAERDSLMQIANNDKADISDLMDIVNEVNANFDKIKEAEKYLTVQANSTGELSSDARTRIKDNFNMINEILKKNKADIASLNQKLKNAGGQSAQLKQTVDRLTAELEQRSIALVELRDALTTRDVQIASLTSSVQQLVTDVEELEIQNEEQMKTIKDQDKALNSGYYIFGTSKELKEAKIVSGGFISSTKVLNESIDKSIFIRVDIREVKNIPVYAKKVKILSDHPKDSYTIGKDSNGQAVVQILDYKRFWSLGQFLIMQVD